MASHEFRALLSVVDGNAQRMISMQDRLTASELAERARRIRGAVRSMTQIIDDLMESTRHGDGRGDIHYHPTQIDLKALLHEACDLQRELTPHAQIREVARPRPVSVEGDATLLRQVFGNILSNAVKYSPAPAVVDVSIAQETAAIVVVIEDHGIGIPEKERTRVFERDYRGANTSGIAGRGVGLYVAKTLVDLHKGSIAVDCRGGQGSRFEVRLPLGNSVACQQTPV